MKWCAILLVVVFGLRAELVIILPASLANANEAYECDTSGQEGVDIDMEIAEALHNISLDELGIDHQASFRVIVACNPSPQILSLDSGFNLRGPPTA